MRIPTRKIYRAFPELDAFSDEQCERFMKRIEVSGARKALPATSGLVVALVSLVLCCAVSGFVLDGVEQGLRQERSGDTLSWIDAAIVFALITAPLFLGLFARDALLRRHLQSVINEKLERIRCLKCKYILIGQTVEDAQVRCPECGRVQLLSELGIVAEDLIPPEMGDPLGQSFL